MPGVNSRTSNGYCPGRMNMDPHISLPLIWSNENDPIIEILGDHVTVRAFAPACKDSSAWLEAWNPPFSIPACIWAKEALSWYSSRRRPFALRP